MLTNEQLKRLAEAAVKAWSSEDVTAMEWARRYERIRRAVEIRPGESLQDAIIRTFNLEVS